MKYTVYAHFLTQVAKIKTMPPHKRPAPAATKNSDPEPPKRVTKKAKKAKETISEDEEDEENTTTTAATTEMTGNYHTSSILMQARPTGLGKHVDKANCIATLTYEKTIARIEARACRQRVFLSYKSSGCLGCRYFSQRE